MPYNGIEWRVENKRDPQLLPSSRGTQIGSVGPVCPGTRPVPPATVRQLDRTAAKNARNVGGRVLPGPLPPPFSQNRIFPIQGNPVPLWESHGAAGACVWMGELGWAPRVKVPSTAGWVMPGQWASVWFRHLLRAYYVWVRCFITEHPWEIVNFSGDGGTSL